MNKIQSEAQLENNLISQLQGLEYDFITIKDEKELLENLKKQIETHNFSKLDWKTLSSSEFTRVLNHLDKWNVFERAKILIKAEELLMDEMPIIPMCSMKKSFAKNPKLHGERLSYTQFVDFKSAYFEE